MTKNYIKKLASASYTRGRLDSEKINKIAKSLKRGDLKVYIKNLKSIDSKHTVTITVPDALGLNEKRDFLSNIYPDKRLVFNIDPSLLTGIRIIDSDNEYELSLKSFLENSIKGSQND